MSEPNGTELPEPPDDDAIRQHAQDPVEGPDGEAEPTAEPPRVHPEDPAEG